MEPGDLVRRDGDRTGTIRMLLAVSSIAAGVIHAAVVPEHLEEAWVFGTFIIIACFQIAWAIRAVSRPSALVFAAGALVNGALIAIWLASRTSGMPIGPEPWMPEPAGLLDVSATLLALFLLVGSLAAAQMRGSPRGSVRSMADAPSLEP